jgi:hypothetical protein
VQARLGRARRASTAAGADGAHRSETRRYDLDGDRAFEVLKRYSQDTNRKLRDVAQELVDTRKLPR